MQKARLTAGWFVLFYNSEDSGGWMQDLELGNWKSLWIARVTEPLWASNPIQHCHDRDECARSPFVRLSVDRPRIFFSVFLSAIISFFFLAPFIASLSSFGRCPFPQFLTRLLYVLLLLNLARVSKIIFFPLQNGIFFWTWIVCRTCSPPAVTKLLRKAVDVLHSDKSGHFSPMTRGGVTAGTFLKLMT
jgi:hypothetical protein